jgi:hypothetical protein
VPANAVEPQILESQLPPRRYPSGKDRLIATLSSGTLGHEA